MPQSESSASHARDLGYLDRFLAKLEGEAAGISGERGARLKALLGEERARWAEINALLSGQDAKGAGSSVPAVAEKANDSEVAAAKLPPAPGGLKAPRGLTVGGLIQA